MIATPPGRDAPVVTIGIEEELQVVDAAGALAAHDFDRGRAEVPDRGGASSRELHRCVLEVKTPVCGSPDEAVASLAAMREIAATRARAQGQRVLAAGLHPFSRWTDQPTWEDPALFPRFARLLHDYADILRGVLAFGMHVHLGCSRPALRMPVMNALRNVLPEILALSVSSPFSEGRDTGMACWRHGVLSRLPRAGIPASWPDEAAYAAHVQRLRRTGCLQPEDALWEDLRLHHRFGTLEVRICDAAPSLDRVWLIAALLQAEVATLEAEVAAGNAPPPLETALIEENKLRVCRHGLSAELVDWHAERQLALPARLWQWLDRLGPAARRLGTHDRLGTALHQALQEGSFAQRQRAQHRRGDALAAIVDGLVAQTAAPLSLVAGAVPA